MVTLAPVSSPRVLFMHGLESGPHGDKVQRLREAGLDVEAADMKMSIRRLDRENSVVRNLLRSHEARLAGLSFAASAAASIRWRRAWPAVLGVAAGAGWLAKRGASLQRDALRQSYETCIAIQEEAVARHRPDVVLGSSWGGAIAVELVLRGIWRGPTVLLAPAFHRVAQRLGSAASDVDVTLLQRRADAQRVVVFHDPTDETVPFGDSVALQGVSEIELRRVHAGGHRLMGLLDDGSLVATLRDVAS
jgi:hypothetical protein